MQSQQWCELKVGDRVRYNGKIYTVDSIWKDGSKNQSSVEFRGEDGEVVLTQRRSSPPLVAPSGFIAEAQVIV